MSSGSTAIYKTSVAEISPKSVLVVADDVVDVPLKLDACTLLRQNLCVLMMAFPQCPSSSSPHPPAFLPLPPSPPPATPATPPPATPTSLPLPPTPFYILLHPSIHVDG